MTPPALGSADRVGSAGFEPNLASCRAVYLRRAPVSTEYPRRGPPVSTEYPRRGRVVAATRLRGPTWQPRRCRGHQRNIRAAKVRVVELPNREDVEVGLRRVPRSGRRYRETAVWCPHQRRGAAGILAEVPEAQVAQRDRDLVPCLARVRHGVALLVPRAEDRVASEAYPGLARAARLAPVR